MTVMDGPAEARVCRLDHGSSDCAVCLCAQRPACQRSIARLPAKHAFCPTWFYRLTCVYWRTWLHRVAARKQAATMMKAATLLIACGIIAFVLIPLTSMSSASDSCSGRMDDDDCGGSRSGNFFIGPMFGFALHITGMCVCVAAGRKAQMEHHNALTAIRTIVTELNNEWSPRGITWRYDAQQVLVPSGRRVRYVQMPYVRVHLTAAQPPVLPAPGMALGGIGGAHAMTHQQVAMAQLAQQQALAAQQQALAQQQHAAAAAAAAGGGAPGAYSAPAGAPGAYGAGAQSGYGAPGGYGGAVGYPPAGYPPAGTAPMAYPPTSAPYPTTSAPYTPAGAPVPAYGGAPGATPAAYTSDSGVPPASAVSAPYTAGASIPPASGGGPTL